MSKTTIPIALRRLVAERFHHRCSYCQTSELIVGASFTVDHILPETLVIRAIMAAMREFNTSGPCDPDKHYTVMREALVAKGQALVDRGRFLRLPAKTTTRPSNAIRRTLTHMGHGEQ